MADNLNSFPNKILKNGQQLHQKVLNITNSEKSKSHHLMCVRMTRIKKITNDGEDMEKRNPLSIISGNVIWCSHYEKQ